MCLSKRLTWFKALDKCPHFSKCVFTARTFFVPPSLFFYFIIFGTPIKSMPLCVKDNLCGESATSKGRWSCIQGDKQITHNFTIFHRSYTHTVYMKVIHKGLHLCWRYSCFIRADKCMSSRGSHRLGGARLSHTHRICKDFNNEPLALIIGDRWGVNAPLQMQIEARNGPINGPSTGVVTQTALLTLFGHRSLRSTDD